MSNDKLLVIIPARGDSKGIPGKNLKPLGGKPLILYSIQLARKIAEDQDICLSTDHPGIIQLARQSGLPVHFTRPHELANDTADMYDVIMHAIKQFEVKGRFYKCILLLQPTSPFRTEEDIRKAVSIYNDSIDMVVSVKKAEWNPEALFYENDNGYLKRFIQSSALRRQDLAQFYSYNGAIYLMKIDSLHRQHYRDFNKIVKFEMDNYRSIDLDTHSDWDFAEFLLEKKIVVIE
jgi:CMP-N,N'-diacetyllegionaminic acid synthase